LSVLKELKILFGGFPGIYLLASEEEVQVNIRVFASEDARYICDPAFTSPPYDL
jgi:hypothetical protein